MIAVILVVALGAEIAVYAALGTWLVQQGALASLPAALLAFFVAIAWRSALVALMFVLAWKWRPETGLPLLTPGVALRLYFGELATFIAWSLWHQPLQPLLSPLDPGGASSAPVPVLLVHGIYCNAGIWRPLRRRLARDGIEAWSVNLQPPGAGIERFADQLRDRVESVCERTGAPKVVLVCHSLGGLVSRHYLQRLGGAARVARLVTIGTPHRGSEFARLAAGREGREMVPGSELLADLNIGRVTPVPTISIYSWHDNLVAPQDSPRLGGADNKALTGVGHMALLSDERVLERVAAEVGAFFPVVLRGHAPAPGRPTEPR